ncbi:hypothetical protein KR215_008348 [Drosophila sulfurigaster]|nr:hypothetical protein KR215_008348 [Drosophila sulfurigaster]
MKLGPLSCEADEVCSNSLEICVKKTEITNEVINVCGANCQSCSADRKYTCVSRNQAALCLNGQASSTIIIDCGEDEVCVDDDDGKAFLCVPSCVAEYQKLSVPCSSAAYTTPTPAPPTTPSTDNQKSICQAASVNKKTLYFFTYADSSCRTYVYCERSSSTSTDFTTTLSGSCSSPNPYFNTVSGKCQASVPDNCESEAPST